MLAPQRARQGRAGKCYLQLGPISDTALVLFGDQDPRQLRSVKNRHQLRQPEIRIYKQPLSRLTQGANQSGVRELVVGIQHHRAALFCIQCSVCGGEKGMPKVRSSQPVGVAPLSSLAR